MLLTESGGYRHAALAWYTTHLLTLYPEACSKGTTGLPQTPVPMCNREQVQFCKEKLTCDGFSKSGAYTLLLRILQQYFPVPYNKNIINIAAPATD